MSAMMTNNDDPQQLPEEQRAAFTRWQTGEPAKQKPRPREHIELGQAVARRRIAADLTQADLAQRIHNHPGYIPRIEGGMVLPRPDVLRRIAAATDSDPTELLQLAGYLRPAEAERERENDTVRRFRIMPETIQKLLVKLGNAMILEEESDDLEKRRRRVRRGASQRPAEDEEREQR